MFNVGGLASGLDTNSIVSQLMAVERQPVVRLQTQQAVEQARQQALKDVRTRMTSLQTSLQTLSDPTMWADTQTVCSSDSTHLGVASTGGAAAGAYTVAVTRLASADQYSQTSANTTAAADDTFTIKVGTGTAFNVDVKNGDSLDQIASKINGTTGIPVYATVAGGKLVISGKSTGAANTVSITGGVAAGFAFGQTAAAKDAQLTVDSGLGPVAVNSSSNTVTNAIAGVTLTLQGPTPATTVTVGAPAPNTQKISDAIQAFADQYNSTIDFIQGKLDEQVVANPQSVNDRTKGVLNGDPSLESFLTQLRRSVSDIVQGAPSTAMTLSQVGLGTGAPTGSIDPDAVDGKITLDEDKLGDALTANFSAVKALFTKVTGSYATEGVQQRLQGNLDPFLKAGGVMDSRDAGETNTLKDIQSQIDDWTPRLTAKEASLRQQFTAMEVALSKNQSLSSAISGQLASLASGVAPQ